MKHSKFIAMLLALSLSVAAVSAELTLSSYRGELEKILSALDAGNLANAQSVAKQLGDARIVAERAAFKPDMSILTPITKAATIAEADAQKKRIRALLAAMPQTAPSAQPAATASIDLLERLRHDEEIELPPKDGDIDDGGISHSGLFYELSTALGKVMRRVRDTLDYLVDLFGKLLPKAGAGGGGGIGSMVNYLLVSAAVIAAVMLLRAYFRRRTFKKVALPASVPEAATAKDADPLSRGADEWEKYALQLSSSGRYREAVRAWYHAALVLLFRSGLLNYRKGRTNWEYCYSLAHDLPWREHFVELTGAFEIEWYGKTQSQPDDAQSYADAAQRFIAQTRGGRSA